MSSATDAYFWSAGKKVPLRPDDRVAVDLAVAKQAGLAASVLSRLRKRGRPLRGEFVLIPMTQVEEKVRRQLDEAGAVSPVYRADDETLLIVLPEVRVETDDATQQRRLDDLLKDGSLDAIVMADAKPGRTVLQPRSGRGRDALAIANRVYENVHPPVSQARFLRVVPRPAASSEGTRRSV
jgi:hypothetical protein